MSPSYRERLVRRLDVWAQARRDYRLTLCGRLISFALVDDDTLLEHAVTVVRHERFLRRLRDQNRRIAA